MSTYRYDPSRRVISVGDPRLNRLLVRNPDRCASISEYAAASGIDTAQVIDLLGPYLDEGSLSLEVCGEEIFVLTAPGGRPLPMHLADVAPNMWETLRQRCNVDDSARMWRLIRGLERAGWRVSTDQGALTFGLATLREAPMIGVDVGNSILAVLPYPASDSISSPVGYLAEYDRAGAAALGIVCDQGALDEMVTAVRRWVLSRQAVPTTMSVLILEAPRFNPTLLSPGDAAVSARAVTRSVLETLDWDEPQR